MKKLLLILSIMAVTAFGFTPTDNVQKVNEPQIEAVQYVAGWAAKCVGYDSYGNKSIGYSYGYSTAKGAVIRARQECSIRGGVYNQFWNYWYKN
jgi:hypothetical protein